MKISNRYYYLIAGFPEMFFDQSKLPFRVIDFKEELRRQLTPGDFKQVEFLCLPADNDNLLRLLEKKEEPINPLGNFTLQEWEEYLRDPAPLPSYQHAFLAAYRDQTPLLPNQSWQNQLTTVYYDYVLKEAGPFLRKYLAFERDLNNLLVAISERRHQRPVDNQYIGQYALTEMVKRSQARDFGLANDYPYLDKLQQLEDQPDIWERERGIDRLRWNFIGELNTFHYFSLEVILGYMLRLMILERWAGLDPQRGEGILKKQLTELTGSLEIE